MEIAGKITRSAMIAVACLSFADRAEAQSIGGACSTTGWLNVQPNQILYCNSSNLWSIGEEITSGGLVGIGTAGPLSALDIKGGAVIGSYAGNNAAPSNGLAVSGNVGIGTSSPGANLEIAATTPVLKLNPSGGAARAFTITSDGGSTTFLQANGAGYFIFGAAAGFQVEDAAPSGSFVLLHSGNIGMNASSPVSTLSVGGGVAIGTTYANGNAAASNNLIMQGSLGIGSASPVSSLDISQKNDALALPSGMTGQRPTAVNGMIRYNSSLAGLESYVNGAWESLVTSTGSTSSINLGTSASVTNPQRSGDPTTGFYSAAVNTLAVAANGLEAMQWNTVANGVDYLSITPGLSGTAPKIAVAGSTSPQNLNFAPNGATGVLQFSGGTMFWQDGTNFNIAVGPTSMSSTVSQSGGGGNGQNNTALGYQALNANTTGFSNTAIGSGALAANTSGLANTAVGTNAHQINATGNGNTAVGVNALAHDVVGNANVAVGTSALQANTNAGNIAIGNTAMSGNVGGFNTVIGYAAYSTTGASANGSDNTIIGQTVASTTLTSGGSNILIGTNNAVDTVAAGTSYNLNIGNLLQGDMTNSTALGKEALYLQSTASSVDYLQIAGGAAGSPGTVTLSTQGTDTDVNLAIRPKGAGNVGIGTTAPTSQLTVTGPGGVGYTNVLTIGPYAGNGGAEINLLGSNGGTIATSSIATSYTGGIELYAPTGFTMSATGLENPAAGSATLQLQGNLAVGTTYYTQNSPTNGAIIQGNVGIGNTSPGGMLDIGLAGTTLGTMRLEGNTSGYVQLQSAAAAGNWTMTLPTGGGTSGYVLTTNGSGVTSWVPAGTGATIMLGTSLTVTNPQRSGDATTGFYSAAANTVAVAANGIEAEQWNTAALGVNYLSITPGATGSAPVIGNGGSDLSGTGLGLALTGRTATAAGLGGAVTLTGGAGNGANAGGLIGGTAGQGGATGAGGAVSLTAGSGGATSGAGGAALITAGAGTAGNAGGGLASLTGGAGQGSASGGGSSLLGGAGGATGAGGAATVTGGAGGSTSGAGGGVTIAGGKPVSGNGGAIALTGSAGVGGTSAGGNVTLTGGAGVSSGAGGNVTLNAGNSPTGTSGSILGQVAGTTYMTVQTPGTANASFVLNGNDALALPAGLSTQRPSAGVNGMIRYNSTLAGLESYVNGAWESLVTSTGSTSTIALGTSASVTNPQRSGDATTGLFSPAASVVATATGGIERIRIDSAGKVGIGTTVPAATLDIAGTIYSRRVGLTDAATIAVDWSLSNIQSVTLGGNRSFTFANPVDGARYILIIKQDATGSRTATWPAAVHWPGGTAPTLTTTASKKDFVTFVYDGSDSTYDGISISQNY